MHFAEAAASHADFAYELPALVAEIRQIFTSEEIATHLAALERAQAAELTDSGDLVDDLDLETPAMAAARSERFATLKFVLVAQQLGTS